MVQLIPTFKDKPHFPLTQSVCWSAIPSGTVVVVCSMVVLETSYLVVSYLVVSCLVVPYLVVSCLLGAVQCTCIYVSQVESVIYYALSH